MVTPAPGDYSIPSKVVESPGKSIGQKLDGGIYPKSIGPGPAGYDSKSSPTMLASQKYR